MSDIIGIVDDNGNLIVSYAYDAWGKVLSIAGSNTELGNLNPFRYRSYYYDSDIEMYYLQSRYYDPEICRFINSDDVNYIGLAGTVGSYNAFAYCENNPISSYDYTGKATDYSSLNVPSRQIFSQRKRYAANKKLTKEIEAITPNIFKKYINGQGRVPYKHYLFGAYYTSYNGCGWIATYNALIYLKKNGKLKKWIKPHDVINGIENNSTAKYIGTTFGITTKSISKYIDSLSIDSTVSERTRGFKTAEIEKKIKKAGMGIVYYSTGQSFHFVMVRWNNSKKEFLVYNYANYSDEPKPLKDLSKLRKGATKFIISILTF